MASVIKLSKGLDMNLKGKAAKEKATFVRGSELALTPDAFVGMTPKVVVKEGVSLTMNGVSIPLFTPQPANAPTNIRGEHVVGYFAVCPIARASVVVDDPFRPYFKKLLPGF